MKQSKYDHHTTHASTTPSLHPRQCLCQTTLSAHTGGRRTTTQGHMRAPQEKGNWLERREISDHEPVLRKDWAVVSVKKKPVAVSGSGRDEERSRTGMDHERYHGSRRHHNGRGDITAEETGDRRRQHWPETEQRRCQLWRHRAEKTGSSGDNTGQRREPRYQRRRHRSRNDSGGDGSQTETAHGRRQQWRQHYAYSAIVTADSLVDG